MDRSDRFERMLRDFRDVSVGVIGDVMVDAYVHGSVTRISPEGPHLVFLENGETHEVRGGAANVSANVRSLGGTVVTYGVHESPWECVNINSGQPIGRIVKSRYVDGHTLIRVDSEPPAAVARPSGRAIGTSHSVYAISDYGKGTVNRELVESVISKSLVSAATVVVDPAKCASIETYRGVDVIKPNRHELASLARSAGYYGDDQVAMAESLLDYLREGGWVVVTRDRDSVLLVSRGNVMRVQPRSVDVCDVTGAGDTMLAALSLGVGAAYSVPASVELAVLAAECAVSRRGTTAVSAGAVMQKIMCNEISKGTE